MMMDKPAPCKYTAILDPVQARGSGYTKQERGPRAGHSRVRRGPD